MPPRKKSDHPSDAGNLVFIHAADLQLGKPFHGVTDDSKRARVQQERFEAIRRIAAIVRDRRARFVVLAGDVFDSPTPSHATISAALGAFAAIPVPIYAIPGNHDHAGPDSVWETGFFQRERARVAGHFHLLESAAATAVDLGDDGTGPASVVLLPCPLLRRHHTDDPTAWIRDFDFSSVGDGPRIVIAHGCTTVFTSTFHIDEEGDPVRPANTIGIDRLPLPEIDYCALGDCHSFVQVGPKAFFSGTPEADRFPKTGQDPGHVACVTVGRGVLPKVEAVRTGRFRWVSHTITLDTAGDAASAAAVEAVRETDHAATDVQGEGGDIDREPHARGPAYLDAWLTQTTRPTAEGEPGYEGVLARITIAGTVSLAGRQELDRVIESWEARLLRLDLIDAVSISPTADEIHDLTARPGDPIISRVATELVQRLHAGGPEAGIDAIRHALSMLHSLAHPETVRCSDGA